MFLRGLKCKLGYHPVLHIIQSFGAAQHIGCPDCGRELAIHHGMRAVLPWSEDFAQLYRDFGYNVDAATARWHQHRDPKP